MFRSARPTSGGFLPFAPPKVLTTRLPSGMVARFGGFFKRGRVIGLSLFTRTRLRFVNLQGEDLPSTSVSAVRLKSRTGVRVTLSGGQTAKLQASRVIAVPDGVRSKAIEYAVEAVEVAGANVVNRAQQRFFPLRTRALTVPLLLYSARFTSRDALFGYASGSAVLLTDPDGETMRIPLRSGHAQARGLARGEYLVKVDASGFSFKRPVSLSRDQVVDLAVVSYLDLGVIFGGLTALAIGLVLVGRPAIRERVRGPSRSAPRRPRPRQVDDAHAHSPRAPAALVEAQLGPGSGCPAGRRRRARVPGGRRPRGTPGARAGEWAGGSTATLRGSGLAARERVRVRVGKSAVRARTSRRGFLRTAVRIPVTAQLPVPVVARHDGRRFRMKFDIDGPSTLVTSESSPRRACACASRLEGWRPDAPRAVGHRAAATGARDGEGRRRGAGAAAREPPGQRRGERSRGRAAARPQRHRARGGPARHPAGHARRAGPDDRGGGRHRLRGQHPGARALCARDHRGPRSAAGPPGRPRARRPPVRERQLGDYVDTTTRLGPPQGHHLPGRRQPRIQRLPSRAAAGPAATSTTSTAADSPTAAPGSNAEGFYAFDLGAWRSVCP